MSFKLSRGGTNVAAEVQRWQYFLIRNGFNAAGQVDGDFGPKTEDATKMYQAVSGLGVNGKLDDNTLAHAAAKGYTILPDAYYKDRKGTSWPPKPSGLASPSNDFRNDKFECFEFKKPGPGWEITTLGKCAAATVKWRDANIERLERDDLKHVSGFPGYFTCHRLASPKIAAMIDAWKAADLLHLLISYQGAFYARYKKGQEPAGAHGTKKSKDVGALSNHAFGTAMDFNAPENGWQATPAQCGSRGSVRELVAIANGCGFYWGGHYSGSLDGMHFEVGE